MSYRPDGITPNPLPTPRDPGPAGGPLNDARTVTDVEIWIRTAVGDVLAERLGPNNAEMVHRLMKVGDDIYRKLMENEQFRRRLEMGERAETMLRYGVQPHRDDARWAWDACLDHIRGDL